jgi:hypothetical protein
MAGYGQFTDYTQRPDGGYDFVLKSGETRTFAPTEEAEKIKARIDSSKPKDERTAEFDWRKAASGALSTVVPGAGLAPLLASDADARGRPDVPAQAAAPAYKPGDATRAFGGPTVPVAAQAAPTQAQAPAPDPNGKWDLIATEKDGSRIYLMPGGDPRNPKHTIKETPGRAASAGGLAQRSQSITGAQNVDPEQIAAIEGVAKSEQEIRDEQAARVNAIAGRRQELMAAEKIAADNQAAVQAHENAVKTDQFKALQAKYEEAEREYADMPEAQARREKTGNTGATGFAKALARGLGALGASMARTPNFVAQAMEADAERRMRRDEAELRVKKDSVNQLSQLKEKMGGSLDLARAAYQAIESKKSAIGFEMLASQEQDQAKAASLQLIAQQEWKGHLKWKEELTRKAEGEISKSYAYVPGSSGSAARREALSLDEQAKVASTASTTATTDKTRVETEKLATETKGGGKLSDTSANALSNIDTALEVLPGVAESSRAAGRTYVREGSEVMGYSLQSDATKEYQGKAKSLIRIAAKAVEGDAASESHVKALEDGLLSGDPKKRAVAQVELTRILQGKRKNMEKNVPGAAQK